MSSNKVEDFYFMSARENQELLIVARDYWAEHEAINDMAFDGRIDDILPDGFLECGESSFQYHEKGLSEQQAFEKGRQLLIDAGFEEIPNPWE
jgi:hypothetical protein